MKVLAAMLVFSMPLVANAQYPGACFPNHDSYYESGKRVGERMAERTWESNLIHGDCNNKHLYVNFVKDRLVQMLIAAGTAGPSGAPVPQSICRWYGYVEGMLDAVQNILDQCWPLCTGAGEFWGEFGAEFYCDISIVLDGLGLTGTLVPPVIYPIGSCGHDWQEACFDAYHDTAHGMSPGWIDPFYPGCHQVATVPPSLYAPKIVDFTGLNFFNDPYNPGFNADFTDVYIENKIDHCTNP